MTMAANSTMNVAVKKSPPTTKPWSTKWNASCMWRCRILKRPKPLASSPGSIPRCTRPMCRSMWSSPYPPPAAVRGWCLPPCTGRRTPRWVWCWNGPVFKWKPWRNKPPTMAPFPPCRIGLPTRKCRSRCNSAWSGRKPVQPISSWPATPMRIALASVRGRPTAATNS